MEKRKRREKTRVGKGGGAFLYMFLWVICVSWCDAGKKSNRQIGRSDEPAALPHSLLCFLHPKNKKRVALYLRLITGLDPWSSFLFPYYSAEDEPCHFNCTNRG